MSKPIHIFLRQCNCSINRKVERRPEWFSFQKCFDSLLVENADITICLDGSLDKHHVDFYDNEVIEFTGGTDHASLQYLLDTVKSKNLSDDTVVYLVEDDYLHRPDWDKIMLEGFQSFNVDYISLYDHPDKYFFPMYDSLQSKVLHSKSLHWRTTPSTCNTYAGKMSTFKRHWDIHMKYCRNDITHDAYDHTKFVELWEIGSNLITPMPGYSTHCELPFISPIFDWSTI